jgi:dihydrodipicolinate synthase/N-acetylneuraminate lyase
MTLPMPSPEALALLRRGVVIPASPLALDGHRRLDPRRQRALYRYYAASGAGGIAVAVHTTQFEIREPRHGLFEPVLRLASEEIRALRRHHARMILMIAGVCGTTEQATAEARLAASLGYDACLLSLAAMRDADDDALLAHCRAVSREIPLIGFYLQPAVGGRALSFAFWRRFAEIPNAVAIKIAPFNRYQTLDVMRAVADSGRAGEISLYTGNDDNIIADLLTPFSFWEGAGPGSPDLRRRTRSLVTVRRSSRPASPWWGAVDGARAPWWTGRGWSGSTGLSS